jgi:Holliday junction resolvase RusA-like endonuclease
VEISISLSPPDKRAFDLDNRVKAILDLLVMQGVIEADNHLTVRKITIGLHKGEPGARVIITSINSEEMAA